MAVPGVHLVRSDLDFILKQIKIAEVHAAGTPLQDLIPNIRLAYGLRSVDGSENNLLELRRYRSDPVWRGGHDVPAAARSAIPPAPKPALLTTQTSGTVIDSQPRTISNLIVDQTANNPAAYASAYNPGANGHLDFGIRGRPTTTC